MTVESFQVTSRMLKDREDALNYCLHECQKKEFGCALKCDVRKHFEIPPHGPRYPGSVEILGKVSGGSKEKEA